MIFTLLQNDRISTETPPRQVLIMGHISSKMLLPIRGREDVQMRLPTFFGSQIAARAPSAPAGRTIDDPRGRNQFCYAHIRRTKAPGEKNDVSL